MKFVGNWNDSTKFNVGDVVIYTDGCVYHLQKPCNAGITPINTLFWGALSKDAADILIMLVGILEQIDERIPSNISEDCIFLKGTGDKEYIITVDDTGDTPELAVDEVETEGDGE